MHHTNKVTCCYLKSELRTHPNPTSRRNICGNHGISTPRCRAQSVGMPMTLLYNRLKSLHQISLFVNRTMMSCRVSSKMRLLVANRFSAFQCVKRQTSQTRTEEVCNSTEPKCRYLKFNMKKIYLVNQTFHVIKWHMRGFPLGVLLWTQHGPRNDGSK